MYRIQKSVCFGDLTQEQVGQIRENILSWISPTEDRVLMLPITQRNMNDAIAFGQNITFDKLMEKKGIVFL